METASLLSISVISFLTQTFILLCFRQCHSQANPLLVVIMSFHMHPAAMRYASNMASVPDYHQLMDASHIHASYHNLSVSTSPCPYPFGEFCCTSSCYTNFLLFKHLFAYFGFWTSMLTNSHHKLGLLPKLRIIA
jgi:hypothetical protein